MKRSDVYKAIDSERTYQEECTKNEEILRMISPFNMGQGILAIDVILEKAKEVWYEDHPPYEKTTEYLRKIAGVCVMMGEKYGMNER